MQVGAVNKACNKVTGCSDEGRQERSSETFKTAFPGGWETRKRAGEIADLLNKDKI